MEHRGVKAISLLSQPSFLCGDIMLSHQNWEQKSCSMEQRCQSNFASVPTFISVWRYHVESSKLGAEELLYGAQRCQSNFASAPTFISVWLSRCL
jgi:hypothetical protein